MGICVGKLTIGGKAAMLTTFVSPFSVKLITDALSELPSSENCSVAASSVKLSNGIDAVPIVLVTPPIISLPPVMLIAAVLNCACVLVIEQYTCAVPFVRILKMPLLVWVETALMLSLRTNRPPPGPLGELTISVAELSGSPPIVIVHGPECPPPAGTPAAGMSPTINEVVSTIPWSRVRIPICVPVSLPSLPNVVVLARISAGCPANWSRPFEEPEPLDPLPNNSVARPVPAGLRITSWPVVVAGNQPIFPEPLPVPMLIVSALMMLVPPPRLMMHCRPLLLADSPRLSVFALIVLVPSASVSVTVAVLNPAPPTLKLAEGLLTTKLPVPVIAATVVELATPTRTRPLTVSVWPAAINVVCAFGETFTYWRPLTDGLFVMMVSMAPAALVVAGAAPLPNTAVSPRPGGVVPPTPVQFAAVDQIKSGPAPDHVVVCALANCARARTAAQICNLPYRRIVFCRASENSGGFERPDALPITNRRYGRLQICAIL